MCVEIDTISTRFYSDFLISKVMVTFLNTFSINSPTCENFLLTPPLAKIIAATL